MTGQTRMMDADERDIYHYLKSWNQEFIASREIGRRAGGKKRFRENEAWATPVIERMLGRGILETDAADRYRLKPIDKNIRSIKRWVSPQVDKILKASGKEFKDIPLTEAEIDEYYESL